MALYGPYAAKNLDASVTYEITFAQAAGSVLLGISGAQVLKLLSDKQADSVTKSTLVEANKRLLEMLKNK